MKTSIKCIHAMKRNLFIKTLFACLVVVTLSFAAIPTRAGDSEDKANQAFADWKAANKAVADAKDNLEKARKKQQIEMDQARARKKKKKKDDAQDKQLEDARAEVAAAEAALEKAEAALVAARIALEKAIAELPDGPLKDQLKRERNFPSLVTANGLHTVKFDTPSGQLTVNLPDDMRAGDTISGTVIAEPKGQTKEERTKNQAELQGYVVSISPDPQPPNTLRMVTFDLSKASIVTATFVAPTKVNVGLFLMPNQNSPIGACGRSGSLVAINESCSPISQLVFTSPDQGIITPDPKITPSFTIPPLGQTGRPMVITGPFDGNSSNTILTASASRTSVQDFEKNTENVSGGFGLLAESPRQAVFSSPENVTGPIQITLQEGNTQTTGNYRNVGVNLTAPKTTLQKGESTTLKIEVSGLQGIKGPVPLHLVKGGVVKMQGGDAQTMSIKPAEVQTNGTFTTTRQITGVQTGTWNATATVVVFDICLQDDNNGNTLIFSSETGDYSFCGFAPGLNIAIASYDALGGGSGSPGDSAGGGNLSDPKLDTGHYDDFTKNGTFTSADFNFAGGRIHWQVDDYTHTGSATVQTTSPKQTFTITDRDTRNNTCACGGGSTSPTQGNNPPPSGPGNQPGGTPTGQPSPSPTPNPAASPPTPPGTKPSNEKQPTPGAMTEQECVEQEMEVERLKEEIKKKEEELAGLPAEKRKTASELNDCNSALEAAKKAQKEAADELAKQEKRKKNIENNTGPGKQFPDKDAAKKNFGDYEKDYNDAKKAKDDADKKAADAKKKCDDLKKKLDDLGRKEKSLPGEIDKLKKKLEEAEKALEKWKAEEEKKKKEDEDKKRKEEEERRRTEAEKESAKTQAEASTERIKYLLDNIKSLGLISSDTFWQSQPENNNHLIELLKKTTGDLAEEVTNTPIPLDTLDAIKGLYGVVGALLDPCTTDGKRKTVERLQKRVNPNTGNNYTLDEALDKTEGMCDLLQKLRILASKK